MKNTFFCLLALAVAGCCNNLPKEVSLASLESSPLNKVPHTIISKDYPGHFIDCRAQYAENEIRLVDEIVSKADDSGADVVLYFHGGLSSQKYMVGTLGKDLMKGVFNRPEVSGKLFPIFMNYDAEPSLASFAELKFEDMDSENFSTLLSKEAKEYLNDKGYFQFRDILLKQFDPNKPFASYSHSQDFSRQAAAALNLLGSKVTLTSEGTGPFEPTKNDVEYLLKIMGATEVPAEFANNAFEDLSDKLTADINSDLHSFAVGFAKFNEVQLAPPQNLESLKENLKLRILRILARLALRNDHGFFATIQEEYLDMAFIYVGGGDSVAIKHWDKVKRHAKECFAEQSNGREIINRLLAIKKTRPSNHPLKIFTLSHSAGSIPTAELIGYLSHSPTVTLSPSLDRVVMVVPAINQRVFSELVIPNAHVFNNLDAYVLTEPKEKKDSVGPQWLYSASLLYGVSSMGERGKMMDRMLLIDQHLDNSRVPYKYSVYLCAVCEKPEKVWNVFNSSNDSPFKFIPYPFDRADEEINEGAATHGGTKFPWVSPDLAKRVLSSFGIANTSGIEFKKP